MCCYCDAASYVMQTLLVKTGCMHVLHGRSRKSSLINTVTGC